MSTKDTLVTYLNMMKTIDPESGESLEQLINDPTNDVNNATIASWTKSVVGYLTQSGNFATIPPLKLMHNKALEKTEFDDVSTEITSLYDCAFEFKKAEMNIEDIGNILQNKIEDDSLKKIEFNIDNFNSSLKIATTRAFGILLNPVKYLKNEIIPRLKDMMKNFSSKLHGLFSNMLQEMIKILFQILNEFVNKVFSFVEMIKKIAKSKGFGLKFVTVSFEPPGFGKIDVFGFSLPIPKISLPKVDINFEMGIDNGISTIANNSIINNKLNEFQIPKNSHTGNQSFAKEDNNGKIKKLLLDEKIKEFNELVKDHFPFLNFSYINMKYLDLSGANLSKANLTKADLIETKLSEANLSEANLTGADLIETNLSSSDMKRVNLTEADMSDANLSDANLSEANLTNADLSGTNLSRANLFFTNLTETDLTEANLTDANLSEANLTYSDLYGANLSKAKLISTNLTNADLTEADLTDSIIINISNYNSLKIDKNTNFDNAIIDNCDFIDYIHKFTTNVPEKIKDKKELRTKLQTKKQDSGDNIDQKRTISDNEIEDLVTISKLPN
jgi:uncharacterized protein YjbI with pentapeptide repeats